MDLTTSAGIVRYYYVYNGHGDVVALVDVNGTSHASYSYDEFGVPKSVSESFPNNMYNWTNPYRYDGAEGVRYDTETGLYWMSVRAYDPTLGRFISHDPLGRLAAQGMDFQPYVYAGNNPINKTDPSGEWSPRVLFDGEYAAPLAPTQPTKPTSVISVHMTQNGNRRVRTWHRSVKIPPPPCRLLGPPCTPIPVPVHNACVNNYCVWPITGTLPPADGIGGPISGSQPPSSSGSTPAPSSAGCGEFGSGWDNHLVMDTYWEERVWMNHCMINDIYSAMEGGAAAYGLGSVVCGVLSAGVCTVGAAVVGTILIAYALALNNADSACNNRGAIISFPRIGIPWVYRVC